MQLLSDDVLRASFSLPVSDARFRLLRAADHRELRWKNGLGVTTEIMISPPGAALDDFDWRVSIARVLTDGPFSIFGGIDRQLIVLDGRMTLAVEGRQPIELTRDSPALSFPGDVPARATLAKSPLIDLNVMTRRGRFLARIERAELTAHTRHICGADTTLIVALSSGFEVSLEDRRARLQQHDALVLADAAGVELRLRSRFSATYILVELHAAAKAPA